MSHWASCERLPREDADAGWALSRVDRRPEGSGNDIQFGDYLWSQMRQRAAL